VKVLYIDIETYPARSYHWGMHKQNIGVKQVIEADQVCCFAAKWRGKRTMYFHSEWVDGYRGMVEAAHSLLDEADVVAHWNGKRFDVPHLNRAFSECDITPPSPFKQLDLMLLGKRRFRFLSNKLAHVSQQLGFAGKLDTDFQLWLDCMNGDPAGYRKMERYNRRDTRLLEQIHTKWLPWIDGDVNANLFSAGGCCASCESMDVIRNGHAYTTLGKYQRYLCKRCGLHMRGRKRIDGADLRAAAL
jgi:hypothetical protein